MNKTAEHSWYTKPGYNDHPVWKYSERSFNTVDPAWAAEVVSSSHASSATEIAIEIPQPEPDGVVPRFSTYVQRELPEILLDENPAHSSQSENMAPDKYKGYVSNEIADLVVVYNYSEESSPLELMEPSRVSRIAERMATAAGTMLSATTQNLGVSTLRWFAFDKLATSKKYVGKHRLEKTARASYPNDILSTR
jgi:hypothetical protein